MVLADITRDFSASLLIRPDADNANATIVDAWQTLAARGRDELSAAGFDLSRVTFERSLDLRYEGQSYELEVGAQDDAPARWIHDFHEAHRRRYGHGHPDRVVEAVNARLRLRIPTGAEMPPARQLDGPMSAPIAQVQAWFDRRRTTPIYERASLHAGACLRGPALVVQMDATTLVNAGWRATVLASGALLLEPA
jgi:N-methylhydantoinase A